MKVFKFVLLIIVSFALFPIMFVSVTFFSIWEKMSDKDNLFSLVIWTLLAPIMIFCAMVANNLYPAWEDAVGEL